MKREADQARLRGLWRLIPPRPAKLYILPNQITIPPKPVEFGVRETKPARNKHATDAHMTRKATHRRLSVLFFFFFLNVIWLLHVRGLDEQLRTNGPQVRRYWRGWDVGYIRTQNSMGFEVGGGPTGLYHPTPQSPPRPITNRKCELNAGACRPALTNEETSQLKSTSRFNCQLQPTFEKPTESVLDVYGGHGEGSV